MGKKITSKKIREYWEKNPFHVYESPYKIGTKEFYIYSDEIKDNDVDKYSKHLWRFKDFKGKKVLDIGPGTTGWLVRNYAKNGADVHAIDITERAVNSVKKSLKIFNLDAKVIRGSATNLPYNSNYFDFVSAHGSIEHSSNIEKCVQEIFRVLKPGGEATVSLYYNGLLFKKWFFPITKLAVNLLLNVPGREGMKNSKTPEEFLRKIDGDDNPMSRMYTRKQVKELFSKFDIVNIEAHMFLMHFMPGIIPRIFHKLLDTLFPLKIYVQLKKPKK